MSTADTYVRARIDTATKERAAEAGQHKKEITYKGGIKGHKVSEIREVGSEAV